MEVVSMTVPRRSESSHTVGIPFNKRNVEEWSRLDRLTGMMETAKIETDHWSARSTNAAHKYGKMVDSRERNNKDGTIHESQRKQMEVFQTQVPGGTMQVIRTQTVTTSSKSSKWVSTNSDKVFSDLQLPINPLDLTSQKTKGSVGRSGSIGGRRPPSHPRNLIGQSTNLFEDNARLCHKIHEKAKNDLFGKTFPEINGFGSGGDSDRDGVIITEIADDKTHEQQHYRTTSETNATMNGLFRRKSCSNENVANTEDVSDEESLKRSSKVRRSLQFPKTQSTDSELEWTGGKSLKERAAEIENLLKRSGGTTIPSDETRKTTPEPERKPVKKRDSFVSADTLREVRGRLKKSTLNDSELKDDGIVTEDANQSKVKCFVYGMEAMMAGTKASVNGTGSLESRSSCRSSSNATRSAEWYRRRKSYGFEDVDDSDKFGRFNRNSNMESSTDSGICQSSETVGAPSWSSLSPVSTVVTVGLDSKPSKNSVYLDNSGCSLRVEDTKKEWYNSPWNRKSPIGQSRMESLKSSLSSAKNPWISQLKGTKLVDRNWAADEHEENAALTESKSSLLAKKDTTSEETTQKKSKKVEFCKTEVHFAAESGKFNIVETDGKPPPNDIFRRRRRSNGPAAPKNPNGLPETKFGDSPYEKKLLSSESISEKIEAELKELSKIVIDALPARTEEVEVRKPNTVLYNVVEEEPEPDGLRPRSILKNNKPEETTSPQPQLWKSTVILRNKRYDTVRWEGETKPYASDGENELQVRIRSLRKTDPKWWSESSSGGVSAEIKRRSLPDDILLKQIDIVPKGDDPPSLSVAERVKKVEELKSNNYSSKINFRSGEMTVVQNGSGESAGLAEEKRRSWVRQKMNEAPVSGHQPISCDTKTVSNPPVTRFSSNKDDKTDNQKYQTTRILINFQSTTSSPSSSSPQQQQQQQQQTPKTTTTAEEKTPQLNNINKPFGSWSPGMKNRYFNDLKSTTLVRETIHTATEPGDLPREDIPKPARSVHEIIDQFDSLSSSSSVTSRKTVPRERRRRTMPINYKAPKEYTQADLEEELKNFTENLDKDFRDIYEEEIGSVRKSKREKMIRPVMVKSCPGKGGYDSGDDSDLLADEEVRSYMSTGLVGTDTGAEDGLRQDKVKTKKEIKNEIRPVKISSYDRVTKTEEEDKSPQQKNIASIALKYEDDPAFPGRTRKQTTLASAKPPLVNGLKDDSDPWEKTSNSSSTNSNRRERHSYLNVLSLSEIYSKYFERSSTSSLDNIPETRSQVPPANDEDKKAKPYRQDTSLQRHRTRQERDRTTNLTERKRLPHHHLERKKVREKPDIYDELTRAADEILVAVNDYDASDLASSEDDDGTRRVVTRRRAANLGTISEGKRVTKTEARRSTAVASSSMRRSAVGTQSSASSLESLTSRPARTTCPRLKHAETASSITTATTGTKPLSSRATRLLQRATTRQASMPAPSSSEDLPSYIELAKKRSLRRQRSSASVKYAEGVTADGAKAPSARLKSRTKSSETASSLSRTRDRKTDKGKESTIASKSVKTSVRSHRACETEATTRASRGRHASDKLEEPARRSRTHHSSSNRDSAASTALQRKKPLEKWKP